MTLQDVEFRGKVFKIEALNTYPNHASWTSFTDEVNVKEAFWHPQPGDRVLDIGAAFGSYALTALSEGASYAVCWSPQGYPGETEQEVLYASANANGWGNKIAIFETGLYSKPGYLHAVTLEYRETLPEGISEFQGRTTENWLRVETLDDLAARYAVLQGGAQWMKLDVEGAELDVLQGGVNFIRRHRPKILVEHHLFKKSDLLETIPAFLGSLGYELDGTLRYSDSCTHGLYTWKAYR